ncbi:MAG: AHH domain-containing protein [Parasphingorhabdus sp.]
MMRFSMINRKNDAGYIPGFQRHHLIPLQAASIAEIRKPLDAMGRGGFDFDNFVTNGVLLPSDEHLAIKTGHPLHRGPHPRYNELVIERLLLIIRLSKQINEEVQRKVFFRLRIVLLQSTLRKALIGSPLPIFRLNKRDPGLSSSDFAELDSCVDALYTATHWPPVKSQDLT